MKGQTHFLKTTTLQQKVKNCPKKFGSQALKKMINQDAVLLV